MTQETLTILVDFSGRFLGMNCRSLVVPGRSLFSWRRIYGEAYT